MTISQLLKTQLIDSTLFNSLLIIFIINIQICQHKLYNFIKLQIITIFKLMWCFCRINNIFNKHNKYLSSRVIIYLRHINLHKMPPKSWRKFFITLIISICNKNMFRQFHNPFIFQTKYLLILNNKSKKLLCFLINHINVINIKNNSFMLIIYLFFY